MSAWRGWGVWAAFVAFGGAASGQYSAKGHDWPQWQGPKRNNHSFEKGLLREWPAKGPRLVWAVDDVGGGYGAPSVSKGRVFGLSYKGDAELVWAREAASGRLLWAQRIGFANRTIDYAQGPRSSPTVDGDFLYALGVSGDLACLNVADGRQVWAKKLVEEFDGILPYYKDKYGYAESPLVYGDWVVVTPGGTRATMVALDKKTGKTIWKAAVPEARLPGGSRAAYASIVTADLTGSQVFIQFLQGGIVGVSLRGRLEWRWDGPSNDIANCNTPLVHRGQLFATSGYGKGCGVAQVTATPSGPAVAERWFNKNMKNVHGGAVIAEEFVYGASEPGALVCLDFKTGALRWSERAPGRGSILHADAMLFYRSEDGPMHLVTATAGGYHELGRFSPPLRSKHKAWAHPVLAHGKLYLRDQDALLCYDVRHAGPVSAASGSAR